MQQEEWIKVYETSMPHQAILVKSLLSENNIEAVILNQQDSSYIILGEISVYVALKDSIAAINIIEESHGDESPDAIPIV
ncbi:MAG TPA: DUF2007 domain-containing protein [Chitinophagales bacterium]|nr:DUF2007 domain-containing protein [Chitinophagales bacterium]